MILRKADMQPTVLFMISKSLGVCKDNCADKRTLVHNMLKFLAQTPDKTKSELVIVKVIRLYV